MFAPFLVARLDAAGEPSVPWLRVQDGMFVDEQERRVVLRGCNLGNWLLLEMWMLDQRGVRDQQTLVDLLARRFGLEETRRLLDVYREYFIAERDFDLIRSFNFNVVRVPFDYRLLEDDARPMTLRADAFRWLDRAVELARRHGLYVILDLHGAQGGQSLDQCTGHSGQNRLWNDRELQDRVVWLWTEIARHFAGEPVIAGYDLLNEPFGDGQTDEHLEPLVKLMGRVYAAIRSVDERHVIVLPAPRSGIEVYGDPAARGWQQFAFTEHYYPGLYGEHETLETHARFIGQKLRARGEYLGKLRAPFLVGEFNVVLARLGGARMMRRYFDEYAERGWAATLWSYKLLHRAGGVGVDNWYMVTNRDPLPPFDVETISAVNLEHWFTNLGVMPLAVYEELRAALTNTSPDSLALAEQLPLLREPPARAVWAGWNATDIGGSRPGGQRVLASDAIQIFGGGRDIWNETDQFRFLWQSATGRFELSARIVSLEETSPHAKAGLMWRASLDPAAAHVLLHVFPDGQLTWGWRESTGAAMQERRIHIGALPVYLRLVGRSGQLEAAWSSDGTRWSTIERRPLPGGQSDGLAGLAVLAHDNNESLTTATFRDVRGNFFNTPALGGKE